MHTQLGVHFEDVGMAVTPIKKHIKNLIDMGITKVAATSFNTFTQYEDILDILAYEKQSNPNLDFNIIPGIVLGFEHPDQEITLIAKDNVGLHQLNRIISEANAIGNIIENKENLSMNQPIIHRDNLLKYLQEDRGHIAVLTGGKKGVFNSILNSKYIELEKQKENLEKQLAFVCNYEGQDLSYEIAKELVDYYTQISSLKKVSKKELNFAENTAELTGDRSDLDALLERSERYEAVQEQKQLLKEPMKQIKAALRPFHKIYKEYVSVLEQLQNHSEQDNLAYATDIYQFLSDIFQPENIWFEAQPHSEADYDAFQKLSQFATELGHPATQWVINNDTRLGVPYADKEAVEHELKRLHVVDFLSFKEYSEQDESLREYALKTEDELLDACEQFLHLDRATASQWLQNSEHLLDNCFIAAEENKDHYPKFCEDENAEFERLCREGMKWRFPNGCPPEYEERLQHELNIIHTMGYSGYHLIVQDYLKYGRLLGYLDDSEVSNAPLTIEELEEHLTQTNNPRIGSGIGPGRGSAAGSLCCYALGITDIDPIKNGLLFERFLNPERVSMPDIDSDFRPMVRLRAQDYVRAKYGINNVCEIVTKMYLQDNGAIRDVARYLGAKAAYEAKMQGLSVEEQEKANSQWVFVGENLSKAYTDRQYESLSDFYGQQQEVLDPISGKTIVTTVNKHPLNAEQREVLELAELCYGTFKQYGRHAAGVLISKDAISDEMPTMWNSNTQAMQTQCSMAAAESKGYLKMDFLGLKNLAIISDVVKHPHNPADITDACQDAIKRQSMILDNPEVYSKVFCHGYTQGVFQFESPGMREMLKKFQPQNFADIVILVAAYRPGPMDYIPEIICNKWFDYYQGNYELYSQKVMELYPFDEETYRKNKESGIAYPYNENGQVLKEAVHSISIQNNDLKDILKNTYGCPIYQEQIMQIFQRMAGYSLGRADEVRRFMSKKKVDKLAHEKENFIFGNEKEIQQAQATLVELQNKYQMIQNDPSVSDVEKEDLKHQIETFKMPAVIEGCMKKQGLTEEEADQLFEQMMPFAKYGFNKSHAAAYANVSAQTAWLKLTRPADFYASVLNHEENHDKTPALAEEMKAFGVRLTKPTLDNDNPNFSVGDDGNLLYPIQQAKGLPKQALNLKPSKSLFRFIYDNPTVQEKKIEKFIKIGCFNSCWSFKNPALQANEVARVKGSKFEMIRWLKENYKDVSQLRDTIQAGRHLREQLETLRAQEKEFLALSHSSTPTALEYEEQASQIAKEIQTTEKDLNKNAGRLEALKQVISERTQNTEAIFREPAEIFQERQWEMDLLGCVFDLDHDMATIRRYNNTNTFALLEHSNDTKGIAIPCVIVSVGEASATKRTGKTFYPVTLMDRDGNQIVRRFAEPPTETQGIFNVLPNEFRYWFCNPKTVADWNSKPKSVIMQENVQNFIDGNQFAPMQMESDTVEERF